MDQYGSEKNVAQLYSACAGPIASCAQNVAIKPTVRSKKETFFNAIVVIFRHLLQGKNGISALELSRHIGASYNATWRLKHKLMQVMLEHDSTKKLTGRIEIDDSYLGGKRTPGKRGRGPQVKLLSGQPLKHMMASHIA